MVGRDDQPVYYQVDGMIDVRVSATRAVLRTTGTSTLGGPGASEGGETRSARRSSRPAYFCRLGARVAAPPMAGSRGSIHLGWQDRHRGAEVLVAVMRDRLAAAAMTLVIEADAPTTVPDAAMTGE